MGSDPQGLTPTRPKTAALPWDEHCKGAPRLHVPPGADAAGLKEAIVKGVISRHEDRQAAS